MKRVLMYSGGWDSYCASFIYPDAKKVYVNLHTPYSNAEIKHLPKDVEIQELDLQRYALANGFHIPQRNAILALIGAASVMPEAEADGDYDIEVLICGMKEDQNAPDKCPNYFELLSMLASAFDLTGKYHITVKGFFDEDKISLWKRAGKPNMRNVISCYTGENCNNCRACKRRLLYLNYIYPGEYEINKEEILKELKRTECEVDERLLK